MLEVVIQRCDVIALAKAKVVGGILAALVQVGEQNPFVFLNVEGGDVFLRFLQDAVKGILGAFLCIFIPAETAQEFCESILLCHVSSRCCVENYLDGGIIAFAVME